MVRPRTPRVVADGPDGPAGGTADGRTDQNSRGYTDGHGPGSVLDPSVEHQAPNIGLWDTPRTSATTEFTQNLQTGKDSSHSERSPAGTPGPGSQSLVIARRDHHFETTYLTPTDGLQDAVGLESWG